RRRDGAAALLAAPEGRGVVGTVTSLVTVTPGHEAAVAAALGWAGDGLVMESLDHARDAIATLRADDQGRAALLVPHTAPDLDRTGHPVLPAGAVWADRKSTRLNSSHVKISYAVFCLKKKKNTSNSIAVTP